MKKTNGFLVFMVIFLLLILLTGGGLLAYKYYFAKDTSYIGSWEREIDLRGYVIEEMNTWFADPTTAGSVEFADGDVKVRVILKLSDDGKFSEKIDEESYNEAKTAAARIAVSGLKSFLENRLSNAGTDLNEVGKTVDELIEEALGMTAEEYLSDKGPELLPTLSALEEMYNTNGSYSAEDGVLSRTLSGKTINETFFTKDDYLMITAKISETGAESLGESMNGTDDGFGFLYDYPAVYKKR